MKERADWAILCAFVFLFSVLSFSFGGIDGVTEKGDSVKLKSVTFSDIPPIGEPVRIHLTFLGKNCGAYKLVKMEYTPPGKKGLGLYRAKLKTKLKRLCED